jgi:hypothetical protein
VSGYGAGRGSDRALRATARGRRFAARLNRAGSNSVCADTTSGVAGGRALQGRRKP